MSLVVISAAVAAGLWIVEPRPVPLLLAQTLATTWDWLPEPLTPEPLRPDSDLPRLEFGAAPPPDESRASVTITPEPVVEEIGSGAKPQAEEPKKEVPPETVVGTLPASTPSGGSANPVGPAPVVAPAADVIIEPIAQVKPTYPPIARARQIEGDVVLQGSVGLDGTVTSITVSFALK